MVQVFRSKQLRLKKFLLPLGWLAYNITEREIRQTWVKNSSLLPIRRCAPWDCGWRPRALDVSERLRKLVEKNATAQLNPEEYQQRAASHFQTENFWFRFLCSHSSRRYPFVGRLCLQQFGYSYIIYAVEFYLRRCDMNGIKDHISIREASCRWACQPILRAWAIPENAEQSADPRRAKKSKTTRREAPWQNQNGT